MIKNIKKWNKLLFISFFCLFGLSLLFLRIWMLDDAVKSACEINNFEEKIQALGKENEKILVEITELKSPTRIDDIASKELNMIRSPDTKATFIER